MDITKPLDKHITILKNRTLKIKKFYTQEEMTEAIDIYTDFHIDIIEEKRLSVFSNPETDQDGNIVSFYIGLEDPEGGAVTGFDEYYPER